jgi:hypothetical protein
LRGSREDTTMGRDNDANNCQCLKTMGMEDCESSLTMRVKCRRWQLLVVIPLLAMVSLGTNISLLLEHNNEQVESTTTEFEQDNDLPLNQTQNATTHQRSEAKPYFTSTHQRNEAKEFFGGKKKGASTRKNRITENKKGKRKKKKETVKVEPNPLSLAPNATFSACLLIKDDNEILNEWLAYHYHNINMRHLLVGIDPTSSESPSKILQKWRLLTGMEISEWTDDMYMPAEFLENGQPPSQYMQGEGDFKDSLSPAAMLEISNHRYRQRVFLAKCMKSMKQKGRSWVMHIDTDEYVVASKLLRQMKPDYLTIPSMETPGSVLSLLQQAVEKTAEPVSYPCISMLRVLFGSVESPAEVRKRNVPAGFNATSFDTLRFRHHALPHNMTNHGNPKVILDVSAIPSTYFPDEIVYSIHRPVELFCNKNKDLTFTSFRKQPIAVNHYLGSWERYNARNDKRRSRQVYDAKASVSRGKDDGVRMWLQGFVETMGRETAASLLGKTYLAPIDETVSVTSQMR